MVVEVVVVQASTKLETDSLDNFYATLRSEPWLPVATFLLCAYSVLSFLALLWLWGAGYIDAKLTPMSRLERRRRRFRARTMSTPASASVSANQAAPQTQPTLPWPFYENYDDGVAGRRLSETQNSWTLTRMLRDRELEIAGASLGIS